MSMTEALGAAVAIAIVGVIYYVFSHIDQTFFEKNAQRHIKMTEVDTELTKAQAQADEIRLKRELVALKKQEMLGVPPKAVNSDYKVLEDKQKKNV